MTAEEAEAIAGELAALLNDGYAVGRLKIAMRILDIENDAYCRGIAYMAKKADRTLVEKLNKLSVDHA